MLLHFVSRSNFGDALPPLIIQLLFPLNTNLSAIPPTIVVEMSTFLLFVFHEWKCRNLLNCFAAISQLCEYRSKEGVIVVFTGAQACQEVGHHLSEKIFDHFGASGCLKRESLILTWTLSFKLLIFRYFIYFKSIFWCNTTSSPPHKTKMNLRVSLDSTLLLIVLFQLLKSGKLDSSAFLIHRLSGV